MEVSGVVVVGAEEESRVLDGNSEGTNCCTGFEEVSAVFIFQIVLVYDHDLSLIFSTNNF